jgi:hypothetical protein
MSEGAARVSASFARSASSSFGDARLSGDVWVGPAQAPSVSSATRTAARSSRIGQVGRSERRRVIIFLQGSIYRGAAKVSGIRKASIAHHG